MQTRRGVQWRKVTTESQAQPEDTSQPLFQFLSQLRSCKFAAYSHIPKESQPSAPPVAGRVASNRRVESSQRPSSTRLVDSLTFWVRFDSSQRLASRDSSHDPTFEQPWQEERENMQRNQEQPISCARTICQQSIDTENVPDNFQWKCNIITSPKYLGQVLLIGSQSYFEVVHQIQWPQMVNSHMFACLAYFIIDYTMVIMIGVERSMRP